MTSDREAQLESQLAIEREKVLRLEAERDALLSELQLVSKFRGLEPDPKVLETRKA